MPIFVIYGIASGFFTYGVLLMFLRFTRSIHTFIALVLFYGALAGLLAFLIQRLVAMSGFPPYEAAASFAVSVDRLARDCSGCLFRVE